VVELALHDLLKLELKSVDSSDVGAAISLLQAVDVEGALVDVSNVVILEVQDLLGVLNNGRGVRGKEELGGHGHAIIGHESTGLAAVKQGLVGSTQGAGRSEEIAILLEGNSLRSSLGGESTVVLTVLNVDEIDFHAALGLDTNDKGRTLSGSNDLMGVVDRLDKQSIGTLELLDNSLDEIGETNLGVLVVDVLGELGNALGIRLGLKLEALAGEQGLELLVVGDDTVVDNNELGVGVGADFSLIYKFYVFHWAE
jgi:hypothetical protein